MIVGITGSISSGKSTAIKILAKKKYPIFSADKEVKKLYRLNSFKNKIGKKLKFKHNNNLKNKIKLAIIKKPILIKKIEKVVHPIIRLKMRKFIKINKKKKLVFLEIPLLLESKLSKHFDIIICILSSRLLRLNRYIKSGKDVKLFKILDSKQIKKNKKIKLCDINIVNNGNINMFKKKLNDVLIKYQ